MGISSQFGRRSGICDVGPGRYDELPGQFFADKDRKAIKRRFDEVHASLWHLGPARDRITPRGGTTVTAAAAAKPYLCTAAGESCRRGANLKGSYIGTCVLTRDLPRYIELYRRGKLPVDRLMSGRLKLDDINQGFDRLLESKAVRQVVVL
jgi:Zn-dependent alcohol dehydrogenase